MCVHFEDVNKKIFCCRFAVVLLEVLDCDDLKKYRIPVLDNIMCLSFTVDARMQARRSAF